LAQAVEAEVADFLGKHADLKTADGHQRVVRHGHLPEREVMTGIGPVAVRQPRVRDREAATADPDRIRFSPSILPPYMRRSKSIETLLPILYLKGISTGDFSEALAALLGKDAAGLSASAIGRLKDGWLDEHTAWQKRDLSAKRYVYIWADGIHLQARLEDEKQCILVLIGATPEGRKELVGFTDGARESAQDWRDLLLDLKRRGLEVPPFVPGDTRTYSQARGRPRGVGSVIKRKASECERSASINRSINYGVWRRQALADAIKINPLRGSGPGSTLHRSTRPCQTLQSSFRPTAWEHEVLEDFLAFTAMPIGSATIFARGPWRCADGLLPLPEADRLSWADHFGDGTALT
jgi:hypothetical protein